MMIHRVIKRIQRHFRRPDRYYKIDGFTLDMGDNHLLSLYQEDCSFILVLFHIWRNWQMRFGGSKVLLLT